MYRLEISSSDVYNFQTLRTETVMSIQDDGRTTCTIPLTSDTKFGIFYDPCNNPSRAKEGYVFGTVEEIVTYCNPPLVVMASRKFCGGNLLCSVESGEVLIIKEVCHESIRRNSYIKAYSMLESKSVTLNTLYPVSYTHLTLPTIYSV